MSANLHASFDVLHCVKSSESVSELVPASGGTACVKGGEVCRRAGTSISEMSLYKLY